MKPYKSAFFMRKFKTVGNMRSQYKVSHILAEQKNWLENYLKF